MSKLEEVKGANIEERYSCKYCDSPEEYADKKGIEEHLEKCIMNPENKTPATSKHLAIELYPPYPRYKHNDRELDVARFVGWYNRAYDVRTGEYIKEDEWFSEMDNWVEAERDIATGHYKEPHKTKSKAYEKFLSHFDKK